MKALILGLTMVAGMALGSAPKQLNMPKGTTTTLSMPTQVAKVTVADPSLLHARSEGRKVSFTGVNTGSTDVTVLTAEGEMHLRVYVAADKYGLPYN